MKRKIVSVICLVLGALWLFPLHGSAASGSLHWYCVRQKAHRQAIAAPELRFVEDYGGYYIDHVHDERNTEKVVYLTFDAGYENGNVEKILDILKSEEVPGAFFVLKHFVQANPSLARRMNAEGHLVCNHTATHSDLSRADKKQIETELLELERMCKENGIVTSPYFRPPEGSFSKETLEHVQALGYKTVFWSFAYADWDNEKQPSEETALRTVFDNLHNGAVILLHPTSQTNARILPRVIATLKAQGYRFGTLDELCGA